MSSTALAKLRSAVGASGSQSTVSKATAMPMTPLGGGEVEGGQQQDAAINEEGGGEEEDTFKATASLSRLHSIHGNRVRPPGTSHHIGMFRSVRKKHRYQQPQWEGETTTEIGLRESHRRTKSLNKR